MNTQDSDAVQEFLGINLPHHSEISQARMSALREGIRGDVAPTSLVSFSSSGIVALIGPLPSALQVAEGLDEISSCVIIATDGGKAGQTETRDINGRPVALIFGQPMALSGYLGNFEITLSREEGDIGVAKSMGLADDAIDVVLDLSRDPLLTQEVLPVGYFAPRGDNDALIIACESISGLTGQFQKPRYVQYNADICAHGARGIKGCQRCLDVCPADALSSLGEKISVETHLCHGLGACTSSCPTGALSYSYPNRADSLNQLRRVVTSFRERTIVAPSILFFGGDEGLTGLSAVVNDLPDEVIPWKVEELGSVGPEIWLSCLAYGAKAVMMLQTSDTPSSVLIEISKQIKQMSALISALGRPSHAIGLIALDEDFEANCRQSVKCSNNDEGQFASYGGMEEKRAVFRAAIDHLINEAASVPEQIPLPNGTPFGEVLIDSNKCTLCMGCVAVCPAGALIDNKERPCLSFIEWNCIQCGLCENTCPEKAITLNPRLLADSNARMARRVLNEEEPFKCVECGKPFTTQSMVSRMEEKLSGHRMFAGDGIRRLRLCEDCRVKDMFRDGG
ncbi:4Fe-4S binding protein [Arenicellales bacterium nBUS_48]